MAHWEQEEFIRTVKQALPDAFHEKRVLEIGSGEIRGSVRRFFDGCDYLGVDVAPGSSVDRVCPGQDLDEASASYDVAISCECFEHNPFWLETLVNMLRMLKPGGLLVVSCALTGRQEHGTRRMNPAVSLASSDEYEDYYRNLSVGDVVRRLDLDRHLDHWFIHANIYHKDLYLVGVKRGGKSDLSTTIESLRLAVAEIRREKPLGPGRRVLGLVDYGVKGLIVRIAGESGFHNLKFWSRRGPERLIEAVVGRDRVQRYRDAKRARKKRDKDNIRRD